jgi:hypothetical protein
MKDLGIGLGFLVGTVVHPSSTWKATGSVPASSKRARHGRDERMILGGVERVKSEGKGTEGDNVQSRFSKIAAYVDSSISKSGPLIVSSIANTVWK